MECTADPGPRPALWKHTVNLFTVWLSDQLTFYTVNNGVVCTPPTGRSALVNHTMLLFEALFAFPTSSAATVEYCGGTTAG